MYINKMIYLYIFIFYRIFNGYDKNHTRARKREGERERDTEGGRERGRGKERGGRGGHPGRVFNETGPEKVFPAYSDTSVCLEFRLSAGNVRACAGCSPFVFPSVCICETVYASSLLLSLLCVRWRE